MSDDWSLTFDIPGRKFKIKWNGLYDILMMKPSNVMKLREVDIDLREMAWLSTSGAGDQFTMGDWRGGQADLSALLCKLFRKLQHESLTGRRRTSPHGDSFLIFGF